MSVLRFAQVILAPLLCMSLFLAGCEDEDANNLNQAQTCLDKVSDDAPEKAGACSKYLKGMNTKAAWTIQCSIDFMVGGLTATRIMNAYKALDESGNGNSEAYFIGTLALDDTADAESAFVSCSKSQVDSLIYIAALSKTGTYLNATVPGGILDSNGNVDQTQLNDALQDCEDDEPTCNKAAIGESVIVIGESYCAKEDADADVCNDINTAIENAGGDASQVGHLLTCLLKETPGPDCSGL